MSWKGSLEITYSFIQRLFNFHLQTLSREVEGESAVALSHEGEGAAHSAARRGRSGEAEGKALGKARCGSGLAMSQRPPVGCSAALDAMSSIGPWDLLRFLQVHPRACKTPRLCEDRYKQPGYCQRCGAVAQGGEVCVPLGGLCSITATSEQGFGDTGTTKIHQ